VRIEIRAVTMEESEIGAEAEHTELEDVGRLTDRGTTDLEGVDVVE